MRLKEIHVEGFGHFNDYSKCDIPPGFSVFQGNNEAGKSTLLAFLRAVLFGFPNQRSVKNTYPPLRGGRHGGRIHLSRTVNGLDQKYIVERVAGKGAGTVRVVLSDGSEGGEEAFQQLAGAASRTLFENVFAFSLSELQSLSSSLNGDGVRDAIYGAGLGTGPATIRKALQELQDRSSKLFVSGGKGQQRINGALQRIDAVRKKIEERKSDPQRHVELQAQLTEAETDLKSAVQQYDRARRRSERVQLLIQSRSEWLTFEEKQLALGQLPAIDDFPESGILRLDAFLIERRGLVDRLASPATEKAELDAKLLRLTPDARILSAEEAISKVAIDRANFDRDSRQFPIFVEDIPAPMLELRHDIASAIGLPDSAIPFAGELIEVRADEAPWRGAIERVLRSFALSVLVEERNYAALSNHVNSINLGKRLFYHRTGHHEAAFTKPLAANLLHYKLNVKDGPWAEWLKADIKRFNYVCVDHIQAFRNADRAVTREGQIRHGKAQHEKDDRFRVDDRRNWVLGFDNREKLELYEGAVLNLAEEIAKLQGKIDTLTAKNDKRSRRALHCQTLADIQWQEIDVLPLMDRIAALEKLLTDTREGNTELKELAQKITEETKKKDRAETELGDLKNDRKSNLNQIKRGEPQLLVLEQSCAARIVDPHMDSELDRRYQTFSASISLEDLDRATTSVVQTLANDCSTLNDKIHSSTTVIERLFAEFKRRWPMEAGDLDDKLASAPDFFAKLQRLQSDRLPEYEHRFFELLRTQSHQNLAALSSHLSQARKNIEERMSLVNDSLSRVPFNTDSILNTRTILEISVSDRQIVEVREFKQEINQTLSHAWSEDREFAESRFVVLRTLVERLGSQDPQQRRWRDAVLDVREHVEFIGHELDVHGTIVEIYRSGAGKSGGQRQKLATTCLAAALRYQLGGSDAGAPMYAPVVVDEAFDKADPDFTALAMNIFVNFGFQMIVATPLKSVMTLEPFIGGACFVDIRERKSSSVLLIEYDSERQRLNLPEVQHAEAVAEISG